MKLSNTFTNAQRLSLLIEDISPLILSPVSSPVPSPDPLLRYFNDLPSYTLTINSTPITVVNDRAEIESIYFPSYGVAESLLRGIKKSESSKPSKDKIYTDAQISSKPLSTVYLLSLQGKVNGQKYLIQNSDDNISVAKKIGKLETLKLGSVPIFYIEEMLIDSYQYLFFDYTDVMREGKKIGFKDEDVKVTEFYKVVEEIIKNDEKEKKDADIERLRIWKGRGRDVGSVKDGERIVVL
ncbi:hypothetical protein TL16_g09764 [Triparma laevis f. inornata]|uniref:Uncharacterized protein n=1 Tax=Triparma laevis f. inornata TaxID=1714386 RepID=A0A9W7EK91_9STRA|nr:hypothetical protein TL16_g09764 [Triparma laevis f. inornata]